MKRLVVLVALGALAGALGSVACGGGGDKPPLTPDTEHMSTDDGGLGGEPATGGDAG
jgi:hypothetical protein